MRKILMIMVCAATSAPACAAPAAIMLTGRGVQIYACKPVDGSLAWRLKAPDADLFDAHGKLAGHHSAGPTWRAADGSAVTGEKLAEAAAPSSGAIPWLLLRAKTHAGTGLFAGVAYISRTQTEGGTAPAGACDAALTGAERRVPYSAIYTFFPG